MRLVRHGALGKEKPGVVHRDGTLRDLSAHMPDIGPLQLSPHSLARLRSLDPETLPVVPGNPRLGVPLHGVRKFIAIGLNYREHAAESKLPIPQEPVVFMKAVTALSGPDDDVVLPRDSSKADWEVELGVVIGTIAQYVEEAHAIEHVAGYVLVNDVSEREFQLERGGTWDKGKGCDTFGPTGPWLVTADEIGDPQAISLWLDVNGERMQTGSTATMIFTVRKLVSYVSRFMTLEPGDIITTGTPCGVGMGRKPKPVFLKAGDVMSLGSDQLGTQRQHVRAPRATHYESSRT
jgi:2,4-diketo-3-deoxy-L-fuconate hydrolase